MGSDDGVLWCVVVILTAATVLLAGCITAIWWGLPLGS
jgi:hypothetical protein